MDSSPAKRFDALLCQLLGKAFLGAAALCRELRSQEQLALWNKLDQKMVNQKMVGG